MVARSEEASALPERFQIRTAAAGDEETILALLHDLAVYEKLTERFKITREIVMRDYLSDRPLIHCDLAFEEDRPVGIATWFWIYMSFSACRSLFLEDLFVRPESRGRGHGLALLAHLAKIAREAKAGGIQWRVLEWNKPSIDFYERLGAERIKVWHTYFLSGDALANLAS
jgi:GNAT superfamily N-acetyltransferase